MRLGEKQFGDVDRAKESGKMPEGAYPIPAHCEDDNDKGPCQGTTTAQQWLSFSSLSLLY